MVCCRESGSQSPLCLMWQGHIMKHVLSENRNENKKKHNMEESRVLYGAPTTKRQKPNIIGSFLAGPDFLAQCRRQNRGAQRILLTTPQPPEREKQREAEWERGKAIEGLYPCEWERSRRKEKMYQALRTLLSMVFSRASPQILQCHNKGTGPRPEDTRSHGRIVMLPLITIPRKHDALLCLTSESWTWFTLSINEQWLTGNATLLFIGRFPLHYQNLWHQKPGTVLST